MEPQRYNITFSDDERPLRRPPRRDFPKIIAAVLAVLGLFWAVLLFTLTALAVYSSTFLGWLYVPIVLGFTVWASWGLRAMCQLSLALRRWLWSLSLLFNGGLAVLLGSDRLNWGVGWWALAGVLSAIALVLER